MARYVFDNVADIAVRRMEVLQTTFDPVTRRRLSAVGVAAGWRCLEIGAGGGSVARWLASRVGPSGSVLATDINPRLVGSVPSNVDVRVHDIVADDLPANEFDLVHARLVLFHLPQRERALQRIMRALKPGGRLVLDEFDCTYCPVLAAPSESGRALFIKGTNAIHSVLAEAGADIAWGRNAYAAMAAAGFVDLELASWSQSWVGGSTGAALHEVNLRQVGDQLFARNLISTNEFESFLELVASPDFAVVSYPLMTTWGRKRP
jgi:SAM-dependent methyltransferase